MVNSDAFSEKPVWVGQVSRDIGIRFTTRTWYLTTHKIDPNVDDSREYVFGDLIHIYRVGHFGYVKGVKRAGKKPPRKNLTGVPYFTDGFRLVINCNRHGCQEVFHVHLHLIGGRQLSGLSSS